MKLIFVRHGQTDYNKQGLLQGMEKDIPLNEEGRRQVAATAEKIPTDVDRIISSPLVRARQTAEIINECLHKEIEFDDALKEFSYGSLAGKTWPEIAEILSDPKAHEHDESLMFDYRAFGGESADDVKHRVAGFVDMCRTHYPNETILVTAHGGTIRAMHILYPREDRGEEPENASIHEFDF